MTQQIIFLFEHMRCGVDNNVTNNCVYISFPCVFECDIQIKAPMIFSLHYSPCVAAPLCHFLFPPSAQGTLSAREGNYIEHKAYVNKMPAVGVKSFRHGS